MDGAGPLLFSLEYTLDTKNIKNALNFIHLKMNVGPITHKINVTFIQQPQIVARNFKFTSVQCTHVYRLLRLYV